MKDHLLTILLRTAILFAFWFCLSGKTESFYLLSGLLTSTVIAISSLRLWAPKRTFADFQALPKHVLAFILYGFWLLSRIILAAWHVSCIIMNPRMPIKPRILVHKTFLKTDLERVIFANSITLTPGTITAEIQDDRLTIHQLDDDSNSDIVSGAMEKKIARILQARTQ